MKDGSKFLLEGKDLSTVLKTPYGKQEILDYSINGNVIEWTFLGKDQKFLGKYSLILVVNKNSEGMVTTDACNFVELVACSCEANGADDAGVQTESVDLVSKVDIGGNGGGSYDDSELRDAIESLEQIKANKPILISIEALGTPAHQAEDDTMYWTPEQVEAALSMTLSELYEQAQTIEVLVDIMGQTLYPESAVRYEDDSIEFRYPISLPAVSGFYVLAIRRSPKDLEGVKAAIILGGQLEEIATKSELTELSAEVGKKQDTITDLATIRSGAAKGATAIQEVKTINGQSIVGSGNIEIQGGGGGGMSTPSGDPMHYMYEAVGAEWNGTGADIERQGVYGDTITHKAGYWYLNELGDITTEEMRTIYAYSFPMQRRMNIETAFAKTPIRTNIAVWDADSTSTFGSIAHSQADLRGVCAEAADMEIFAFVKGSQSNNIQKHMPHLGNSFNRAFYDAVKLRKIIGYLNVASSTDYQTFMYAEMLEEVRMWKLSNDFSFAYCSKLSKASLLFAITNSAATKAITITLHADAYARLAEDADIVAALAEKTNVSLAK